MPGASALQKSTPALAPSLRFPLAPLPSPRKVTWITQFQTGHGWTAGGGGAASNNMNDSSDFVRGSQAAYVQSNGLGGGSTAYIAKTAMTVDLTARVLVLVVKFSDMTKMNNISIFAGNDALTSYYQWSINPTGVAGPPYFVSGQWAYITLSFADATTTGTPTRSAITAIRVAVGDNGTGAIRLTMNGVGYGSEASTSYPNGAVAISFDDTFGAQMTLGKPKLDSYGFPATAYPIIGNLSDYGGGGYSLAQLRAAQDYSGWEVAGHAMTSASHSLGLPGMTPAQRQAELLAIRKWMYDNSFRGDGFAYPNGTTDAASIADLKKLYSYARLTFAQTRDTIPVADRMLLRPSRNPGFPSGTLANAQADIDKAVANKGLAVLVIHNIVTTPSAANDMSTANFNSLIDYIASSGLPVVTLGDLVRAAA